MAARPLPALPTHPSTMRPEYEPLLPVRADYVSSCRNVPAQGLL